MKKILAWSVSFVFVASVMMWSSCKKTQHPTNPTPDNYRILSYTKYWNAVNPTENYRFYYDAQGRLSSVEFTNNNIATDIGTRSKFYYSNDTIYKEIRNIRTNALLELDTFIHNTSGQIVTTFMPGVNRTYDYFGKLLTRVTELYYEGLTSISGERTYTSDNKDLLALNYDGKLTANFSSTYTTPLAVYWTYPSGAVITHASDSYTDVLTGHTGTPVTVDVTDDATPMHTDYATFPATYYPKESYGVFPDKANRPGDLWQLLSFTQYGYNFYQNAHLIKSVYTNMYRTDISYDIDADSKIKSITTHTVDTSGTISTAIYSIQYETF